MPNCCVCHLADRDPAAYHALNERLIASAKATGTPTYRPIAREFMHLWPDKDGQTKKQKEDTVRKALAGHMRHIAGQMQEAREEEKEHAVNLAEIADEIIVLCRDNAVDARKCAQQTNRAQDYMFSSNAASHFLNFYSRIKPESEKTKSGLEEMRE